MVSQNERDAAYADGYNDGFRQGKQSRAHAPKETCPRCAGSGFETDSVTPCEFCGGDGLVFERDAEEYGATTTTMEGGISWTALLAVLERLRSKNGNPDNQWYHGWNAAIQCLINDINARSAAAAAVEQQTFKNTKEAMLYAERNNIPAVVPVEQADELVDEVQRRMDQVVEAAVEWHQAGREGAEWFEAAEKLGAAIDSLLELRSEPARTQ